MPRLSEHVRSSSIIPWFATAFLALAGCGGSEEGAQSAPGGGAQQQAMPVQVLVAQPTTVPITLEAVGQTEGVREVEVRARVGGILEERLYNEGAVVEAKQPMFQIDPKPFEIALAQAKAALAQQKAGLTQARREAARLEGLVSQQAVSQREYDEAVSAAELAEAGLHAAEARVREAELNLSYTLVRAPVAGISDRARQFEGALISTTGESSLLTRIYQVDPIRAQFSLAYSDLAALPGGQLSPQNVQGARLILPNGDLYAEVGKLDFSASAIDPQLGTVQFRAEFSNPNRAVLPGQFVRVRVLVGEQQGVYLVPQAAVMQSTQGTFVFLVRDGKATVQPVKAGEWFGQDWVIKGGLQPGDQVIVNNLIKVRPGAPVQAIQPGQQPQSGHESAAKG